MTLVWARLSCSGVSFIAWFWSWLYVTPTQFSYSNQQYVCNGFPTAINCGPLGVVLTHFGIFPYFISHSIYISLGGLWVVVLVFTMYWN